jgi:hypothetical protein
MNFLETPFRFCPQQKRKFFFEKKGGLRFGRYSINKFEICKITDFPNIQIQIFRFIFYRVSSNPDFFLKLKSSFSNCLEELPIVTRVPHIIVSPQWISVFGSSVFVLKDRKREAIRK